jgi:hypothetical protein
LHESSAVKSVDLDTRGHRPMHSEISAILCTESVLGLVLAHPTQNVVCAECAWALWAVAVLCLSRSWLWRFLLLHWDYLGLLWGSLSAAKPILHTEVKIRYAGLLVAHRTGNKWWTAVSTQCCDALTMPGVLWLVISWALLPGPAFSVSPNVWCTKE